METMTPQPYQSFRTQIINAIVQALQGIRAGATVPGQSVTYSTQVRGVHRNLQDQPKEQLPALFVTDPSVEGKPLLADMYEASMTVFVSGMVYDLKIPIPRLDLLWDDCLLCIRNNPQWITPNAPNGLALRTRVRREEGNTEIEEPYAAFVLQCEVDYIERPSHLVLQTELRVDLRTVDPSSTTWQQINDTFFNVFCAIPGITWVEQAELWPIPPEQIPLNHTPGIFFQGLTETYQYTGSRDTIKKVSMPVMLLAVDLDPTTWQDSLANWYAQVKLIIGNNSDLGFLVNTIDIQNIQVQRSSYPLIRVDADLIIRYVQPFQQA
jgi:hypothetical protein